MCITGRFSRFNNQKMNISTIKQDKIMFTPFDNKRYVCDGNIKTYAWGHKDIPVNENDRFDILGKVVGKNHPNEIRDFLQ